MFQAGSHECFQEMLEKNCVFPFVQDLNVIEKNLFQANEACKEHLQKFTILCTHSVIV